MGSYGLQTFQTDVIALGYPPELDGKVMLLKIPHTFIRAIIIELKGMCSLRPDWLAFIVLKVATEGTRGQKI